MAKKKTTLLDIRNATSADIPKIAKLVEKAYDPQMEGYKKDAIRGQITNFPEGCFFYHFE